MFAASRSLAAVPRDLDPFAPAVIRVLPGIFDLPFFAALPMALGFDCGVWLGWLGVVVTRLEVVDIGTAWLTGAKTLAVTSSEARAAQYQ